MLGPNLKYSSCLWNDEETGKEVFTLVEAEDLMLSKMCQRAELNTNDKLHVLDLGCGSGRNANYLAQNGFNVYVFYV